MYFQGQTVMKYGQFQKLVIEQCGIGLFQRSINVAFAQSYLKLLACSRKIDTAASSRLLPKALAMGLIIFLTCFIFGEKETIGQIRQTDASCNYKNGNCFVSFADIFFDEKNLRTCEFLRFYNSKLSRIGMFGFGWGVAGYETRLVELPDGTVMIQEGAGARYVFEPTHTPSTCLLYTSPSPRD